MDLTGLIQFAHKVQNIQEKVVLKHTKTYNNIKDYHYNEYVWYCTYRILIYS